MCSFPAAVRCARRQAQLRFLRVKRTFSRTLNQADGPKQRSALGLIPARVAGRAVIRDPALKEFHATPQRGKTVALLAPEARTRLWAHRSITA